METAKPFIIAIDGRSGSGKSTLAEALLEELSPTHSVTLLRLEDTYPGWRGLHSARQQYTQHLLPALAELRAAAWSLWDWENDCPGGDARCEAADIVIVEGVGALSAAGRDLVDLGLWLNAPEALRRDRSFARDGQTFIPYWSMWAEQEKQYLAEDHPSHEADLIISTGTGSPAEYVAELRQLLSDAGALLSRPLPDGWATPQRRTLRRFDGDADPAALFHTLFDGVEASALLESTSRKLSDPLNRNRYSILAAATTNTSALMSADATGTTLRTQHVMLRGPQRFFDALAQVWPEHVQRSELDPSGPCPQWVGYLGYELKREVGAHNLSVHLPDGTTRADAQFFAPDVTVVLDHQLGTVELVSTPEHIDAWEQKLRVALEAQPIAWPEPRIPRLDFQAADTGEQYREKIRAAQRHIHDGNSYEVCLTTELSVSVEEFAPFDAYRALRAGSPAPFAHYLKLGPLAVASISPERFMSIDKSGALRAEPIKGTRPRGATDAEDAALRRDLATHPKDRAENIMIVDLLRNDLSHHAVPGSLSVSRLCAVESYATVHQMVSTIDAQLAHPQRAAAALGAAFPPGSMTGAPKLSTMGILDDLEERRARGLYSGAVGYLGFDGSADFSVVIRTLVCDRLSDDSWHLTLGLGGAITADSDPQEEWDEVRTKSVGVLSALGASFPEGL